MSQKDTAELFDKIQNGDAKAFQILFDSWYDELCRFAILFVSDPQTAEDIVQNLFVKLWENRDRLTIKSSPKSYLYTSVRNNCLNQLRGKKKKIQIEYGHSLELATDYEEDESEITKQLYKIAMMHIEELPERCRVIFTMSRNTEMTNREIAEHMNITEKTVENQITIALRKLREQLTPQLKKLLSLTLIMLIA